MFTYWQERNENCVFANAFSRAPMPTTTVDTYEGTTMDLEDGEIQTSDVVETN